MDTRRLCPKAVVWFISKIIGTQIWPKYTGVPFCFSSCFLSKVVLRGQLLVLTLASCGTGDRGREKGSWAEEYTLTKPRGGFVQKIADIFSHSLHPLFLPRWTKKDGSCYVVEVGPTNSVSRVPLARSGFAFSSREADLHSLSGAQGHSQTTEGTSQWAPPLWWTFKRLLLQRLEWKRNHKAEWMKVPKFISISVIWCMLDSNICFKVILLYIF